jgi:DNA polymerase-3 subunit delta'
MARLIDSVIGHRDIWERLIRQQKSGRLPHAMAFSGIPGIGKKRVAWAFAQALVCDREESPCGECPACRRVEIQQSESVFYVEPQNNVIKIESAHQILQFLNLRRLGRARAVIIDSAQSLNPQAANALLKAIEEPPEQTYFILLAAELSQLLPTLRSRLQILRFSPLSEEQLKRGADLPPWILRSARGSFENLENFRDEEAAGLRDLAFGFLAGTVKSQREGLDEFLEGSKDRESALRGVRFLQQLLRDWSLIGTGEILHADLEPALRALPGLEVARRVNLWRRAFQLEQDLLAHADRTLSLENFFYQAKNLGPGGGTQVTA